MSALKRRKKGSSITEFGPSLFLFLIVIFFPLLDMLGMAAVYGCCWYLNFMCVRELSVRKESEAAAVQNEVNAAFDATGFARFIGIDSINEDVKHSVSYTPAAAGQQALVSCSTEVTAKPFITVPLPFVNAPGLNADVKFTIGSQRPREVTN
ncbi:MAG: hypothetical protein K2X77_13510 [Candidatus Obscuribacterales bacterium]|jgi:hypothetical protein|nr:hypothetical protein [Candidatus Obscuribacterales bacterium]